MDKQLFEEVLKRRIMYLVNETESLTELKKGKRKRIKNRECKCPYCITVVKLTKSGKIKKSCQHYKGYYISSSNFPFARFYGPSPEADTMNASTPEAGDTNGPSNVIDINAKKNN